MEITVFKANELSEQPSSAQLEKGTRVQQLLWPVWYRRGE